MVRGFRSMLVLALAGALAAVTTAAAASKSDDVERDRNLGYGLLHQLLSDLSKADKLLYVKIETKPVEEMTERLVSTTKRVDARIEKFADSDPGLRIDETGLPKAEVETRLAIRKTRTHELAPLVGLKGAAFERSFLMGHQKALDQLRHLTGAVLDLEKDEERRAFLVETKKEFGALYEDVSKLLERRYFRTAASEQP